MSNSKKWLALLLVMVMVASVFAGCTPDQGTMGPSGSTVSTPAPSDSKTTEPSATEPDPTEPDPTKPDPTEPKPTEPDSTEHTHSFRQTVQEPTCTRDGYTTYACECGESYTDDVVAALGHDVGDWFTVDSGTERRNCNRCGLSEDRKPVAKPYTRDGDYIYFGSWPQSAVMDNSVVIALNGSYAASLPTAGNNGDWISYGYHSGSGAFGAESIQSDYMWYRDVEYDGQRYRGVYFTSYRPGKANDISDAEHTYQTSNGYATGMVYWFRWEPVQWRIIQQAGGKAMLLCQLLIDAQPYHYTVNNREGSGSEKYASNYAHSSIRAWLNETFYTQAFTQAQQSIIRVTTVDNSVASTVDKCHHLTASDGFECANTQDRLFLLSLNECTDSQYGFGTCNGGGSLPRSKSATDYAKCQGICVTSGGSSSWWQRSPAWSNFSAFYVSADGYPDSSGDVVQVSNGVCPALWITL